MPFVLEQKYVFLKFVKKNKQTSKTPKQNNSKTFGPQNLPKALSSRNCEGR